MACMKFLEPFVFDALKSGCCSDLAKSLPFPEELGLIYGMCHKKVPVFRNTLPWNGNFAFRVRFRSVLQFPVFYCCVNILKVRRKERLKL